MTYPIISTPKQGDFLAVPGSPLCYWLPEDLMQLIAEQPSIGRGTYGWFSVRDGINTGDNSRFVRFHWETNGTGRWCKYSKGGGYGKWLGFEYYFLDWGYYGERIINARLPGTRMQNLEFFFTSALCYSLVARGALGARFTENAAYDGGGLSIQTQNGTSRQLITSILNSRISSYLTRLFAQDIKFRGGYVERIPQPRNIPVNSLALVSLILKLKKSEISTDLYEMLFVKISETEKDSQRLSSIRHTLEGFIEQQVFVAYEITQESISIILSETGTPAGWHPLISGYDALPALPDGLDLPPLPQDVHDHLAAHERRSPDAGELARIKANLRALYEAGPGAKDVLLEDDSPGDDDEREAGASGAHIPIPTETFLEELSVKMQLHPISVYWLLEELRRAGARCKPEELRLLHDRLSVLVLRLLGHRWPRQVEAGEPVPEWADQDGIIPLTGSAREQTLTERVRLRLRAEEGDLGAQRSEALLAELTGLSLDEWLRRQFFAHHVRQFKHRPVAWHLASTPPAGGKGKRKSSKQPPAFECIIYYHACAGDILARVRTQYVEPLLHAEQSRQHEARKAGDDTAAAQANTRLLELEDVVNRLRQVEEQGFACADLDKLIADEPLDRWSGDGYTHPDSREELLHNERAWHVDINDGVRVNIAPLQLAGLLVSDVLKAADAKKALADRARWRSDERRWVREGKLPRCGWLPDSVPESEEWTRLAPQRRLEQERLEEKRRRVQEGGEHETD